MATIVINRPEKANAMDEEVWQELENKIKEIESNDYIRAIILTGAEKKPLAPGWISHRAAHL